jgi:hypothetical protein
MEVTEVIGAVGATVLLIAFFMNQTNRWRNDMLIYDLTNFVASTLLMIYAVALGNPIFVLINGVWGIFSLKDVLKKVLKGKNIVIKMGK